MIKLNTIPGIISIVSLITALLHLPSLLIASYDNNDANPFLISFLLSGFIFVSTNVISKFSEILDYQNKRMLCLVTVSSWLLVIFLFSIPYLLIDNNLNFVDALFESCSGITSTGASILKNVEDYPRSLLFWRILSNWAGGIGIIMLIVTILPFLKSANLDLFKNENNSTIDSSMPQIKFLSSYMLKLYLIATIFFTIILYFLGANWFDALCYVMSAISTGGFANHNDSVAALHNAKIEYVIIIIMMLGGIPFIAFMKIFKGELKKIIEDEQIIWMLTIILIFSGLFTIKLMTEHNLNWLSAIRDSLFPVVSSLTTAGLSQNNYAEWGSFYSISIMCLALIGGCAGSTAGGLKILKIVILSKYLIQQVKLLSYPHAILKVKYGGSFLESFQINRINAYFFIYVITIFISSMIFTIFENIDVFSSFSSVASALSNGGFWVGKVAYYDFSIASKLIMMFLMLLGRLEFFTILILLMPKNR